MSDTPLAVTELSRARAHAHTAVATAPLTDPADALSPISPAYPTWARRRDVTLTLFLWLVLAVAGLWVATALLRPLLIVALAALLAYAIAPAVRPWFVSRRRERWWPLPAH
jgi:hypothetical protein